jgi:hypothetical protein
MGTNPHEKEYRIARKTFDEIDFEYRQVEQRIHFCEVSARTYGFMPDNLQAELDDLKPKERLLKVHRIDARSRMTVAREMHDEWERDNRDPDKARAIPHEPDDEPDR